MSLRLYQQTSNGPSYGTSYGPSYGTSICLELVDINQPLSGTLYSTGLRRRIEKGMKCPLVISTESARLKLGTRVLKYSHLPVMDLDEVTDSEVISISKAVAESGTANSVWRSSDNGAWMLLDHPVCNVFKGVEFIRYIQSICAIDTLDKRYICYTLQHKRFTIRAVPTRGIPVHTLTSGKVFSKQFTKFHTSFEDYWKQDVIQDLYELVTVCNL